MMNFHSPLAEMLELTDLKVFLGHDDLELFSTLKEALLKDGQSITAENTSRVVFSNPLISTDDLHDRHTSILGSLVASWAITVVTPLIELVNDHSISGEDLSVVYNGYLNEGQLEVKGSIHGLLSGIAGDKARALLDAINTEWTNTWKLIGGFGDILNGLDQICLKEQRAINLKQEQTVATVDHPLIQLCKDTNFRMFNTKCNYDLYIALKGALKKDGHDTFVRDEVDAMFPNSIAGTDDMLAQEGGVLRAMIESWAMGVLAPMLERLNAYNKDSEDLTISMEGYLHDATLCFDGDLEEFMENLEISIMPDFKEVCDDWKHTLDLIVNFGDMVNAVDDWHELR